MNCEAVKEMLWAYLEKETTAEEAVKIEEHLKNCESCRKELELQKEIMETLAGLPEEELPEGYHAELMQKLQAEAAPNVVPFPVKKKKQNKQPVWKQWGMVAAAVFVVVAAGGMDGMLSFREGQNAAVSQMRTTDMPEAASFEGTADITMEEEFADTVVETQQNAASGKQKAVEPEGTVIQYDMKMEEKGSFEAAVPEMAYTAEESNVMIRSMQVTAEEKAVLLVENLETARMALQAAITAADGYEETAEAENSVLAVIPVEKYDDFVKAVEALGELEWIETADADADLYSITLQLKTK